MYRDVKKVYVTAIVAVLVLSGMVFIANLSTNAAAENIKIQGKILDSEFPQPVVGATVTLKNVHTQTSYQATTLADGTYKFIDPSNGMYIISAQKEGYFPYDSEIFRVDGTKNIGKGVIYLVMIPDKDLVFARTVGTDPVDIVDESVTFPSMDEKNQNVNDHFKYNATDYYIDLPPNLTPIINDTIIMRWNTTAGNKLQPSVDYKVIDLWEGIINMYNSTVINCLRSDPCKGTLWMNYSHSSATADLKYRPVVYDSVIVNKSGLKPWLSDNNYTIDHMKGTIIILSNVTFGVDSITVDYTHYTLVNDATVTLYNHTYDYTVAEHATMDGEFSIPIWAGEFEFICSAAGYEKDVRTNYTISSSMNITVLLNSTVMVFGWAWDYIEEHHEVENVRAYLFANNTSIPLRKRIITATVGVSYFSFDAYPGNYVLIVDANGYEANVTQITVSTGGLVTSDGNIGLFESDKETYTTEISFINDDWNNITVYRNITLNADSRIFGLDYDDIRCAELQLDLALGNADGNLNNSELNSFRDWIWERGPEYVTTEGFFTINSLNYISWFNNLYPSSTEYIVTVNRSVDNFWINTTTYYTTNFTNFTAGSIGSGLVPLNESTYNLDLTMHEDTSTDVYRNYSYLIRLPEAPDGNKYELNLSASSTPNNFNVSGYINITIDPSSKATQPTYNMIIDKSINGTARAKVTGPPGKYHILNSSWDNYTAIVAMSENITFSAADSKDPNQKNLEGANYTWRFKHNTAGAYDPKNMSYGENPTFNYTGLDPVVGGNFTVWLNLTEAGGNITYANISVLVDGINATAVIEADDVTIHTIGMYRHLYVNQSVPVKFNGSSSSDIIWDSIPGEIERWEWHWTNVVNNTTTTPHLGEMWVTAFHDPGEYNLTLNVTDVVGHLSETVNITVFVNDTMAPFPDFMILENGTWRRLITLIEKELYWFNASLTVDIYDSLENLTFNWTFNDGTNATGLNVSHTFEESYTYNVTLTAWDRAGNEGNTTYSIVVQPNRSARPDIKIIEESFTVTPASPEQGVTTTLSVNITNKEGHEKAFNVTVRFFALKGEDEMEITDTVRFYNATGLEISNIIDANETVTVKISWTPDTHGNFTIKINATTDNEHSGTLLDNTITAYVNVAESGITRILTYAVIIAVPIILILIIWLRRKYKRGELFRRREEEEEERGRKRRKKKFKRIKEEEEE